jgi:hypothetical protein
MPFAQYVLITMNAKETFTVCLFAYTVYCTYGTVSTRIVDINYKMLKLL